MPTPKPLKLPKSLAACADLYYEKREARLALQREVDKLEEEEALVKEHLINSIPKSDATGVAGKLASVKVVTKTKPQVTDWEKFYEFVAKNRSKGAFSLLNRAVNAGAVAEYWEAGKQVPGVGTFNAVTLSVSKVK